MSGVLKIRQVNATAVFAEHFCRQKSVIHQLCLNGHRFRSAASTLLNEQGWHPDANERQLAHQEPNEIRAAYNCAKHLPERRRMMQSWADYLTICVG